MENASSTSYPSLTLESANIASCLASECRGTSGKPSTLDSRRCAESPARCLQMDRRQIAPEIALNLEVFL